MAKGAVNVLISSQWSGDRAIRQAESAMRRFERETKGLATSSQRAMARSSVKTAQWADKITASGDRMKSFGSSLTRNVTAPIAAIGALAVNEFRKYDEAMNQSLAIMDVDAKQKKRMEATAKRVASTTRVSLEDAAKSYFYLASAGLDAEQSIAALPAVARFSQAGMFDMSRATDLATDAQSALGLRSKNSEKNLKNLTKVTDVLTEANILSNASVEQFSEALTTKAGGALKVANKSIEEGAAVLSSLADKGVKGAEAGDQLNQFLRDVPRAAVKAKDEWKKFGITVFDQQGNMRNSADVIAEFERVLGPMSDEQRAAALDAMKLNRGVAGVVRTLMGSSKAIRDYETKLNDAGGATERVANKQMGSFQASLDMLKNKFSIIATTVGPNLVKNGIMPIVNSLGKLADGYNNLDAPMQGTVVKMALLAAAAGPAFSILGNAVRVIGGVAKAFSLLQGASALAGISITGVFGVAAIGAGVGLGLGMLVAKLGESRAQAEYAKTSYFRTRQGLDAITKAAKEAADATVGLKVAQESVKEGTVGRDAARLQVTRARLTYKEAVKTSGKDSLEAKEAYNNLSQAKINLQRASANLTAAEEAERQKTLELNAAHNKKIKLAQQNKKAAQEALNDWIKASGATGYAEKQMRDRAQKFMEAGKAGNRAVADAAKVPKKELDKLTNSGMRKIAETNNALIDAWYQLGVDTVGGLTEGIDAAAPAAYLVTKELADGVRRTYKTQARIDSPSKVMAELGNWTVAGVAVGIKAGTKKAEEAIKTSADKVWSAYKTRMSDIRSRSRDIRGTWGLFGAPEGDTKMTTMSAGVWGTGSSLIAGSSFTERLKSQNTALRKWTTALGKLKKMGASKGLMSALMAEGPSALAEVESLVSLGKSEVARASALYGQNTILSKRLATTEVGGTTINIGSIVLNGSGLTKKDVEKMLREAVREATRKKK